MSEDINHSEMTYGDVVLKPKPCACGATPFYHFDEGAIEDLDDYWLKCPTCPEYIRTLAGWPAVTALWDQQADANKKRMEEE